MPETKRKRARPSFGVTLSLGCMVLGIAGLLWAAANIGAHMVRPDAARVRLGSGLVAAALVNMRPQGGYAESVIPSSAPVPQVLYPVRPAEGDPIGTLYIPALDQTLPIIEGTGDDALKEGVGHYAQSVLPGEPDNCVLSGHRDTVFSGLGTLKVGDQFVVQTSAGTFTYQIVDIRIVDKDDRTVIVPTDHAVLTVTTCYPFNYVGSAPDRYVLVADLVTSN